MLTNNSIVSVDLETRRRTVLPGLYANGDNTTIRSMAFDDRGNKVVFVRKKEAGNHIEIVDLTNDDRVRVASEHDVYGLDVSGDGAWIAYGDVVGNVFICDATSGETIWKSHFAEHTSIDALAFSRHADRLCWCR